MEKMTQPNHNGTVHHNQEQELQTALDTASTVEECEAVLRSALALEGALRTADCFSKLCALKDAQGSKNQQVTQHQRLQQLPQLRPP